MENNIAEEECNFCNPELKKNYDLNITCSNYLLIYEKKLNKDVEELLYKLFNCKKFYLPNEIILIIIKFMEYYSTNKISKINTDSVLHFGKCHDCSSKLLKYYDENLCGNHYLPMCIFPNDF